MHINIYVYVYIHYVYVECVYSKANPLYGRPTHSNGFISFYYTVNRYYKVTTTSYDQNKSFS